MSSVGPIRDSSLVAYEQSHFITMFKPGLRERMLSVVKSAFSDISKIDAYNTDKLLNQINIGDLQLNKLEERHPEWMTLNRIKGLADMGDSKGAFKAGLIYAKHLYESGDPQKAIKYFQSVPDEHKTPGALYLQAHAYLKLAMDHSLGIQQQDYAQKAMGYFTKSREASSDNELTKAAQDGLKIAEHLLQAPGQSNS